MSRSLDNTLQMSVETFQVALERVGERLQAGDAIAFVETRLQEELKGCLRLLRWAIVRVEGQLYWCEGAYLKSPEADG